MMKRLFVFAAVAFAISSLGYGLYLEVKIQSWNVTVVEMHQLETKNGECTKDKGYGRTVWSCPTEEMDQLRNDLQSRQWELSNAEETRNLGYIMTFVGPLMIAFIGKIAFFGIELIGSVIPYAAKGLHMCRCWVQQIGEAAASTSERAMTSASSMSNAFKGRTKECTSCAEMIKPKAKVCIHCGRDV